MSVLRRQFLRSTTASLPNAAETAISIYGPESTSEAPYAEGTDYVTRLRQPLQNQAGWMQIDLPSTMEVANCKLMKCEIWSRATVPPGRNQHTALFSNGGGTPADPVLKRTVYSSTTGIAGNDTTIKSILGGAIGVADKPLLSLSADEYVVLTFSNTTGGALNSQVINSRYDLGLHPSQQPSA